MQAIKGMMNVPCLQCWIRSTQRTYATASQPAKRITMPHKVIEKMERVKVKQAAARHQLRRTYRGPLVVSCKRQEFNHYKGQTYSDFTPQKLASGGWKHRQSAGDYFTINAYEGNPALDLSGYQNSTFSSMGLNPKLLEALRQYDITEPTNVQVRTIPPMLEGKNILCAAETGSGKTLAYLLPILQKIEHYKSLPYVDVSTNSPYAVIITPARELADQIYAVARDLSQHVKCVPEVICGGRGTQKILRSNPEIPADLLITTPGIFSKLLTTKIITTSRLMHVVLDEADSLLDDSFNSLTLRLLKKLKISSEKITSVDDEAEDEVLGTQVVFVGATMPTSLQSLLSDIVPLSTIEQVTTQYLHRLMPHVPQKFTRLSKPRKPDELLKLVKSNSEKEIPTLVFCNKSSTANFLGYIMDDHKVENMVFHSNMPQKVRDGRFEKFQEGKMPILVATDIASRGLDTINLQHVINYDFPLFMSDYIHRVGRVGRVRSHVTGFVHSFVCHPWDVELLWKIEAAARKMTELHNVNANIKRKINAIVETKYHRNPEEDKF